MKKQSTKTNGKNARQCMALTSFAGLERIGFSNESDFTLELEAGDRVLLLMEDLSDKSDEISAFLNLYARTDKEVALELLDQAIYAGHFRISAVRTGNSIGDEFTRRTVSLIYGQSLK